FDRYTLPAILPLILIAAAGLTTAAAKLPTPSLSRAVLLIVVVGQLAYLIGSWPYPLTAYNLLAGGSTTVEKVFPIGWGEGTSAAARWLAENSPNSQNQTLFTSNIPAAAAFFPGQLLPLEPQSLSRLQDDNSLLLVPQDWQTPPDSFDLDIVSLAAAGQTPLKQFVFNGLDRATLYTGLHPADFNLAAFQSSPLQIRFAEQVAVVSAGTLPAAWPDSIQIGISWQRLQTADTNYFYRLELVDSSGEIWLTQENPLLNAVDQLVQYWLVAEPQQRFYTLSAPYDLAPGNYTVQVSLFDEQGAKLGVFTDDGRFTGTTAPLATILIPAPPDQLPPDPPNPLHNGVELIGYDSLPGQVETGLPLKLDLWWRQMSETPHSGNLVLAVGGETADSALSTEGWHGGQYYHIRPTWRVPVDLDAGTYPVTLQWFDQDGRPQWLAPVELGQIEVVARPRSFDLPAGITPLNVQLGTVALLQEAETAVTDDSIVLTVTWQAVEPDGVFYTTFVHLLDEAGNTVSQGDRPPLEPTHTWVSGQVIQEQYLLPRPASGSYTIALGLYDQSNGLRLPVYSADGSNLFDDQYLVETAVP
ncbi:MAG: hypothetical protein WAM60_18150, partial [Candidatus Promineifilaceae bacterium]